MASVHPIRPADPVCPSCGINAEMIGEMAQTIEQLEEAAQALERELRGKRALITKLRVEQDDRARSHSNYEDALIVLEHWKERCMPGAKSFEGKRMEVTLAALNAYTPEDLMLCADGYGRFPYMANGRRHSTGKKADWHADAHLIFRDPIKIEMGFRLASQYSPAEDRFLRMEHERDNALQVARDLEQDLRVANYNLSRAEAAIPALTRKAATA